MGERPENRARWPIKLGDYLASGRPVAIQDVGDGAALVKEHRLGRVTAQSPGEFANGLLELLNNPEQMTETGRRARLFAENEMRWEDRAEELMEFYMESVR